MPTGNSYVNSATYCDFTALESGMAASPVRPAAKVGKLWKRKLKPETANNGESGGLFAINHAGIATQHIESIGILANRLGRTQKQVTTRAQAIGHTLDNIDF